MAKSLKDSASRLPPEQTIERLVAAATRLLAEKGPSEIKARAVAEAAQVSTIAVYHHLGGVPELFRAVIDKGFSDLGRAFATAPGSDDPVTALFSIALATRRFAQGNPHLYDLMFGLSTRGSYRPLQAARSGAGARSEAFQAAYAHLVEACVRLVQSGRVRREEPDAIAPQLWSAVHGFVTLELGDHFAQFEDPAREVLQPMMVNLIVGLGDTGELCQASHTVALYASRAVAADPV